MFDLLFFEDGRWKRYDGYMSDALARNAYEVLTDIHSHVTWAVQYSPSI